MKIKALRYDRGGEYISEFQDFLKENGIKSEPTAAYSPQQNGVAEQFNHTLVEAANSMLTHANLSNAFWQKLFQLQPMYVTEWYHQLERW